VSINAQPPTQECTPLYRKNNKSNNEGNRECNSHLLEPPDYQQMLDIGKEYGGHSVQFSIDKFYTHFESCGWRDKYGGKINKLNLRSKLSSWILNEKN
ncbi:MAG: hypothetical protein FWE01_03190, partial [Firmicutes bacterium]|nr:hypothetical protein [Bacillota bacterium]